jgi:8-oxo-dGTP pyrophosphatase MutT (NUDIX family)
VSSLVVAQKAVLLDDAGQICLVKKSRSDPEFPGYWELPGGRLLPDEDLDTALIREVREETGFKIIPGLPVDCWEWRMTRSRLDLHVVAIARMCQIVGFGPPSWRPDDHIEEVAWIGRARLTELMIIPSQLRVLDTLHDPHDQSHSTDRRHL